MRGRKCGDMGIGRHSKTGFRILVQKVELAGDYILAIVAVKSPVDSFESPHDNLRAPTTRTDWFAGSVQDEPSSFYFQRILDHDPPGND